MSSTRSEVNRSVDWFFFTACRRARPTLGRSSSKVPQHLGVLDDRSGSNIVSMQGQFRFRPDKVFQFLDAAPTLGIGQIFGRLGPIQARGLAEEPFATGSVRRSVQQVLLVDVLEDQIRRSSATRRVVSCAPAVPVSWRGSLMKIRPPHPRRARTTSLTRACRWPKAHASVGSAILFWCTGVSGRPRSAVQRRHTPPVQ